MSVPRTAVSLYVALALHVLFALMLALQPSPQLPVGPEVGLSSGPVVLSEVDRRLLEEAPRLAPVEPPLVAQAPRRASDRSAAADHHSAQKPAQAPAAPVAVEAAGTPRIEPVMMVTDASPDLQNLGPTPEPIAGSADRKPSAHPTGGGGTSGYFSELRQHLAAHRRTLPLGLRSATAVVEVNVDADGRPATVALLQSSGLPELDREALALVRRAAPLPPPGRPLKLRIPVGIQADRARPGGSGGR